VKGSLHALSVGLISACATVTVVNGQTETTPSVRTGAYSEEQAIRGQMLYNTQCWQCHGETLAGLDRAPPLVGPQFSGVWDGEPLAALVDRIGTMPPDKPGSLSRAATVDVLTYILWYNGLPIGEAPLRSEQSVLLKMTFQTPPLPSQ
jgi:mono/diheme cytochrome c family protein